MLPLFALTACGGPVVLDCPSRDRTPRDYAKSGCTLAEEASGPKSAILEWNDVGAVPLEVDLQLEDATIALEDDPWFQITGATVVWQTGGDVPSDVTVDGVAGPMFADGPNADVLLPMEAIPSAAIPTTFVASDWTNVSFVAQLKWEVEEEPVVLGAVWLKASRPRVETFSLRDTGLPATTERLSEHLGEVLPR